MNKLDPDLIKLAWNNLFWEIVDTDLTPEMIRMFAEIWPVKRLNFLETAALPQIRAVFFAGVIVGIEAKRLQDERAGNDNS